MHVTTSAYKCSYIQKNTFGSTVFKYNTCYVSLQFSKKIDIKLFCILNFASSEKANMSTEVYHDTLTFAVAHR